MCDVESVNRIAKYLKVNAGKLGYNGDKVCINITWNYTVQEVSYNNITAFFKILMRTTKTESLIGFATILQSLARESRVSCVERTNGNAESQALIAQWLDYAVLYVSPAGKDKHVSSVLLKVCYSIQIYLNNELSINWILGA